MIWFLIGMAAALLLATWFCWHQVFWVDREKTMEPRVLLKGEQYEDRREKLLALIDEAKKIPFEEVHFTNRSGLELYGRYYESVPGAPLQIQMHGYRSNAIRDFSGGLQLALQSGCNVLLIDERAHGKSGGNCLSFGILERFDCADWVKYAAERFGKETPIFLVCISMGAATVLMASNQKFAGNVRGIIADCGYTSPKAIIRKVMEDEHYPLGLIYPLVRLGGILWGRFDIRSADAPSALQESRYPVLFIHGEADHFVPCEMTRENYAACTSEKYILTVPEAGHGLSYVVDKESYISAVKTFLNKFTKGQLL